MTKSELVEEVSRQMPHMSERDVEIVVDTIFEQLQKALVRRDRVEIRGFGVFAPRLRRAKVGRNPRTGEEVSVPQKWVPFFTCGKLLHERINKTKEEPKP